MDYSTRKNLNSPQDLLIVGCDRSFKYANVNGNGINGDLTKLMVFGGGHNRSISSSGGSEPEDDELDMDEENELIIDTARIDAAATEPEVAFTMKNTVKLSFSVESILSDEFDRRAARRPFVNERIGGMVEEICRQSPGIDACTDEYLRAQMLNWSQSIVRPMPVRYLHTQTAAAGRIFFNFFEKKKNMHFFQFNIKANTKVFWLRLKRSKRGSMLAQ